MLCKYTKSLARACITTFHPTKSHVIKILGGGGRLRNISPQHEGTLYKFIVREERERESPPARFLLTRQPPSSEPTCQSVSLYVENSDVKYRWYRYLVSIPVSIPWYRKRYRYLKLVSQRGIEKYRFLNKVSQ